MNMKLIQIGLVVVVTIVTLTLFNDKSGVSTDVSNQSFLSIGTNIWPGYEPLYLARELGYFEDKSVHLVEFASATQVIQAFRNGVISAAAVTLDEALLLKDYGLDPKVILIFDISEGADVIMAKEEVSDITALKDKRIGVENTALGAFVLTRALQIHNMQLSDVSVVSLPINEHDTAFDRGIIDALVTFDPVRSRLMSQGYHEIFTSKEMPGEIVDVLIVNPKALKTHQAQIDALIDGWFRANHYFNTNRDSAAKIMSARQQISASELLDSFQGLRLPDLTENLKLLANPEAPFQENSQRLVDMMYASNLLNSKVSVETLSEAAPLARIAKPSHGR